MILLKGEKIWFINFFVKILLVWKVFMVSWVLGFLIDWVVRMLIVLLIGIIVLWVKFYL